MISFAEKKAIRVKSALDDQMRILHHSPKVISNALLEIVKAQLVGNMYQQEEATKRLAALLGETTVLANLMGRRRMLLEWLGYKKRKQPFQNAVMFNDTPVIPQVSYDQAVADLLSRPVYGTKLEEGFQEVQQLYMGDNAFALARVADVRIANRVQKAIAKSMQEGDDHETAKQGVLTAFGRKLVKELGAYSDSYAETVYRTVANSSFNEGRMQEAQDPEVAEIIGAFMYDAFMDVVTRPNHGAAHGLIAATSDPIWRTFQPPLGYNCRCTLNFVDKFDLAEWGLIMPSGEVKRGWYDDDKMTASINIPSTFYSLAGPDVYKGVPFKTGGSYF
jgi:SPP1 gp7 family putative phage head morphogenesis protein